MPDSPPTRCACNTDRLNRARIAFAGVNTVREFLDHPVLAARDRWRTVGTEAGPVRALLPPLQLGDDEPRMGAVPSLGQHSIALAAEYGCDDDSIDTMLRTGALQPARPGDNSKAGT